MSHADEMKKISDAVKEKRNFIEQKKAEEERQWVQQEADALYPKMFEKLLIDINKRAKEGFSYIIVGCIGSLYRKEVKAEIKAWFRIIDEIKKPEYGYKVEPQARFNHNDNITWQVSW